MRAARPWPPAPSPSCSTDRQGAPGPAGDPDPAAGVPPFDFYEPARWAMGDSQRYAERMNLIEMEPRGELSSTGYALANPGEEYLVLEPDGDGRAVTIQLAAGRYSVEWYNVASRDVTASDAVTVGADGHVELAPPWPTDPAVVYLVLAGTGDPHAGTVTRP